MKIKNKRVLLPIGVLSLLLLTGIIVLNRPLPGSGLPPATVLNASIAAGVGVSMAIEEDGSLWAWGDNSYGQLGDGTTENHLQPIRIMDGIRFQ